MNISDPMFLDIVPKNYVMNPADEDLTYADGLSNGMIVIQEGGDQGFADFMDPGDDAVQRYTEEIYRWCEVSKVRAEADGMFFVGIYADGTKRVRQSSPVTGWLYKKATKKDESQDEPESGW